MHNVEITNDKKGWCRETTIFEDGSRHVSDGRLTTDGKYEYHDYNISADGKSHDHVHVKDGKYVGGHEEEQRPWCDNKRSSSET